MMAVIRTLLLAFILLLVRTSFSAAGEMPVIGFVNTATEQSSQRYVNAFRAGLAQGGRDEGKNVAVEYRWSEGDRKKLDGLVGHFQRRNVDLLVASGGSPAALVAKARVSTIPVVFQVGVDPVEIGLVSSLARPGGNITGVTMLAVELGSKRLELIKEVVPAARKIVLLINPNSSGSPILQRDMKSAVAVMGVELDLVYAGAEREIEDAFARIQQVKPDALIIGADPLFNGIAAKLAQLALQFRIPAIYQFLEFAEAGGLISYGGSITDAYRQVGLYSARILNGDKPADLPVQQSTKLELIINLRTAKSLGISLPASLIARADEVIE
jgi:putative ABC transport system substrate-binding protein